jgi:hypothetical protein
MKLRPFSPPAGRRRLAPSAAALAAIALMWTLALIAGPPPALARVNMEWEIGFDSWGKAGRWLPVFATLSNEPDPVTGQVEDFVGRVEFEVQETKGERGVLFRADVDLPANARKRVILNVKVPANLGSAGPRSSYIKLLRPNGAQALPAASVDDSALKLIEDFATPLIVVVQERGDQRVSLPESTKTRRPQREAFVDSRFFPDSWLGLEAVDLVVIPRMEKSLLSEAQFEALRQWVEMGGRLLVYGGPEASELPGSPLEKLLPVEVFGSSESVIAPEDTRSRALVLASVRAHPSARVLHRVPAADGGADIPLAWAWRVGLGEVHFWAYSARESQSDIFFRKIEWLLWEALLRQNYHELIRDAWSEKFRLSLQSDTGSRVLENAAEPPNVVWVIALIAIYFVVVGPANFMILRKRRRLELAWITIPAIVLVFSGTMYGIGWLTMGDQNLRRDLILIQGEANQLSARKTTLSAFFTARPTNLESDPGEGGSVMFASLAADSGPSLWIEAARSEGMLPRSDDKRGGLPGGAIPTGASGGLSLGSKEPAIIDQTAGRFAMTRFGAQQWEWNGFQAENVFTLGGSGIEAAEASHHGIHLTGQVTNNTKFDIRDAFVLTLLGAADNASDSLPPLTTLIFNDFKRGETIDLHNPDDEPRIIRPMTGMNANFGSSSSQTAETSFNKRFRDSIEQVYMTQLASLLSYPRGRAFLCGYVDQSQNIAEAGLRLNTTTHQFAADAFIMIHIPLEAVEGASMPYGHAAPRIISIDATRQPEYQIQGIFLEDASVVFQMESPFESGAAELLEATAASHWAEEKHFLLKGEFKEFDSRPASKLDFRGTPGLMAQRNVSDFVSSLESAMRPETQSIFIEFWAESTSKGSNIGAQIWTGSSRGARFIPPTIRAKYKPVR